MSDTDSRFATLRVKDYMTPNPQTLTPDQTLLDADLLIRRSGVRHLPIVTDDRLVGLLTERDVRRYAPSILDSTPEEYNRIFENTLVGKVMTKEVTTIAPEAPLAEAATLMVAQHRGCLPVMDGERLVGIITRRDLLKFANDVLTGAR